VLTVRDDCFDLTDFTEDDTWLKLTDAVNDTMLLDLKMITDAIEDVAWLKLTRMMTVKILTML